MNDTSGPTSAMPFASYDPDSRCWRTSEATSLWALTLSSLTLPSWGCLHDGELSELPTPEPRMAALDSSSWLPTPISRDVKEQTLGWTWERDGKVQEDTLPRAITSLLPTPTGDDANNLTRDSGSYQSLTRSVVTDLLPTPTAQAAKHGETPDVTANGFGSNLWDIPHLLPTPTATDTPKHAGQPRHKRIGHQPRIADVIEYLPQWNGADTPPQLAAGSPSSDDPHQPPLFPA